MSIAVLCGSFFGIVGWLWESYHRVDNFITPFIVAAVISFVLAFAALTLIGRVTNDMLARHEKRLPGVVLRQSGLGWLALMTGAVSYLVSIWITFIASLLVAFLFGLASGALAWIFAGEYRRIDDFLTGLVLWGLISFAASFCVLLCARGLASQVSPEKLPKRIPPAARPIAGTHPTATCSTDSGSIEAPLRASVPLASPPPITATSVDGVIVALWVARITWLVVAIATFLPLYAYSAQSTLNGRRLHSTNDFSDIRVTLFQLSPVVGALVLLTALTTIGLSLVRRLGAPVRLAFVAAAVLTLFLSLVAVFALSPQSLTADAHEEFAEMGMSYSIHAKWAWSIGGWLILTCALAGTATTIFLEFGLLKMMARSSERRD